MSQLLLNDGELYDGELDLNLMPLLAAIPNNEKPLNCLKKDLTLERKPNKTRQASCSC
ncbi:MAG: hypothetical protein ACPGLY_16385 [Rubripirellula sp.]